MAALPKGFNFRNTAEYVEDGAAQNFIGNTTLYPATDADGLVYGWDSSTSLTGANRSSSIDVRLAGINYSKVNKTFRIDLPSTGSHLVRLAAGDAISANRVHLELFDDSTSLGVLVDNGGVAVTSGSFVDATDTEYTAANWPDSNTGVTNSFSTTILKFIIGQTVPSLNDVLAHFYVEKVGGTGNPYYYYAQQ